MDRPASQTPQPPPPTAHRTGHAANGRRAAFLCLPEMKTTASWQPVGHVLQSHPGGDFERCAVHRLETLITARLAAGASPTDPIFINPRNRRPYSRNVFGDHLRDYINVVASRYVVHLPISLLAIRRRRVLFSIHITVQSH